MRKIIANGECRAPKKAGGKSLLKGKVLMVMLVVVMFFSIVPNLEAFISSRIEGVVYDKETGKPIEGAEVILTASIIPQYLLYGENLKWKAKTNTKGFFKLKIRENLKRFKYIFSLQIKKEGYISFIPEYYKKYVKKNATKKALKSFYLKEGQIKYFKIALKKGGIIKGKIMTKDEKGEHPLRADFFLQRKNNPNPNVLQNSKYYNINYIGLDDNGFFEVKGLEPSDDYYLRFLINGYPEKYINKIKVKRGEITNIKKTFDLTDQTGIEGEITIKGTIPKNMNYTVFLTKELKREDKHIKAACFYNSKYKKRNKYFCKNMSPGIYKLIVFAYIDNLEKGYSKKIIVQIKKNITTKKNINLVEEVRDEE